MKIKYKYIPAKTTSYFQPLDVSINGPFKAAIRSEWNAWFETRPQEFTPKGYRKRPSYEQILQMVSKDARSIRREVIVNSFEVCGIAPHRKKVIVKHLNGRLRGILGYKEGIEDLPEDDTLSSTEEEMSEDSDIELEIQ